MIHWERIDTVFLDMDGTLLDLNFDNHFWLEFVPQRYADRHGLSLADAREQLSPRFRAMEGKLEWYCLDYWSTELQLDLAGLKAEVAGLIAILPHVTEFLEAVRALDKQLVLVTNAHRASLALKMEKTCLEAFFDSVVSSHRFGLPKEHTAFWGHLNAFLPFVPARTMIADDSLPVLRSACSYGIALPIAIRKADSRQPPRAIDEFAAIDDFREIMPR